MKYEGEKVKDGDYPLGQLSRSGLGRVKKSADELYNDMPVMMERKVFDSLFNYVQGHWSQGFTATVKDHQIIHVQ